MSYHIKAKPGDIAEVVLLPGDPLRARWAAETYLENPVKVNDVRGMFGYTGTWKGNRVTFQATGMGMPSLSIYVNELINDFDAKTLIRVGTAGALQPNIKLLDLVLAQCASSCDSPSQTIFKEVNFAPCADFSLLVAADAAAGRMGLTHHVGGVFSSNTFYDERPDLFEQVQRHGALCVEMETAELYQLASRYQRRALAVLTVSDLMLTNEGVTAAQRETGFGPMIEVALEAAFT